MVVTKTNGSVAIARWISLAVLTVSMLIAATLWIGRVEASTDSNAKDLGRCTRRLESLEESNRELREVLHRMDKRQIIIMHKLGASDAHGNPYE